MPRKPASLLKLLILMLKPLPRQTSVHAIQAVSEGQKSLDREEWRAYWQAQGQPWRTEPEIDGERQEYLDRRRAIVKNIEQGIYPFRGIKLNRADVEWLLTTHDNGRGPVDWSDESQRMRKGLDLRGANLSSLDLRGLPLACMIGGLSRSEGSRFVEQRQRLT